MIRALYEFAFELSKNKKALYGLAFIAFIESFLFPIPPDVLLIPIVLASRKQAFKAALIASIASALGGIVGYGIGYWLFQEVASPILAFYGYLPKIEAFFELYDQWGAWFVFGAGFTPFPYKVITVLSGAADMNFPLFFFASLIGRSLRFFLVAGLLYLYGEKIRLFIEKYLPYLTVFFFLLIFGGFLVFYYV